MQHCPNCVGGELKIIAAILERPVIEKILTHLGRHQTHRLPPSCQAAAWVALRRMSTRRPKAARRPPEGQG
jgi:hypothetical protein